MKCERCNSTNVRRSSWKRNERDQSHFVYAPYRCRDCEHRFFRVSRTFKGTVISGIGILALLGFIGSMYIVSQRAEHEAANAKAQDFDPGKKKVIDQAKKGDATAQYNLGLMYLQGSEMTQNYGEALKWFELAAKQGNTSAQLNLGLLYKGGRGVLQDYGNAAQWFQKAAMKGNAEAEYNLASLYKIGQGVKHDMKQAYAWYNLAAAQGYEPAVAGRENISTFMSAADVSEAQAYSRTLIDPKAAAPQP